MWSKSSTRTLDIHTEQALIGFLPVDQDVAATPVQKRGVGFMFQSFALFKHMTVGENIAFGPRIQKQDVNLEARSGSSHLEHELLFLLSFLSLDLRMACPFMAHGSHKLRASLHRSYQIQVQQFATHSHLATLSWYFVEAESRVSVGK